MRDDGDFEIEVAPLGDGASREHGSHPVRRERPFAGHLRRRALTGVIAIAIVTGLIVLAGMSNTFAFISEAFFPGHHSAAPDAGDDLVIFAHTVPWGSVLVDGYTPVQLGLLTRDVRGYPAFQLSRGQHTITYRAAGFLDYACTVTVPRPAQPAKGDCGLMGLHSLTAGGADDAPATRLLDLRAEPERLKAGTLARLRSVVMTSFPTITATIPVGARYLSADGSVATATQPVADQLVVTLDSASNGAQSCVSLCPSDTTSISPSVTGISWVIRANIQLVWRQSEGAGGATSPDIPFSQRGPVHLTTPVSVAYSPKEDQWTVDGRTNDSLGHLVYESDIATLAQLQPAFAATYPGGWTAAAYITSNPAGPSTINVGDASAGGLPTGKVLRLIFQYGVLLTVDDYTASVLPNLTRATPLEIASSTAS